MRLSVFCSPAPLLLRLACDSCRRKAYGLPFSHGNLPQLLCMERAVQPGGACTSGQEDQPSQAARKPGVSPEQSGGRGGLGPAEHRVQTSVEVHTNLHTNCHELHGLECFLILLCRRLIHHQPSIDLSQTKPTRRLCLRRSRHLAISQEL